MIQINKGLSISFTEMGGYDTFALLILIMSAILHEVVLCILIDKSYRGDSCFVA